MAKTEVVAITPLLNGVVIMRLFEVAGVSCETSDLATYDLKNALSDLFGAFKQRRLVPVCKYELLLPRFVSYLSGLLENFYNHLDAMLEAGRLPGALPKTRRSACIEPFKAWELPATPSYDLETPNVTCAHFGQSEVPNTAEVVANCVALTADVPRLT